MVYSTRKYSAYYPIIVIIVSLLICSTLLGCVYLLNNKTGIDFKIALIPALLFYVVFILIFTKRVVNYRIDMNVLILKRRFLKTIVVPLSETKQNIVLRLFGLNIIRVRTYLDGKHFSFLVFSK